LEGPFIEFGWSCGLGALCYHYHPYLSADRHQSAQMVHPSSGQNQEEFFCGKEGKKSMGAAA